MDALSPADAELLLLAREDLADPAALVELEDFAEVAGRVDPRGLTLPRSTAGRRADAWRRRQDCTALGVLDEVARFANLGRTAFEALVADARALLGGPAGLLVAGGAALGAARSEIAGCSMTGVGDVDLFLYGCDDEQAAGVLAALCRRLAGRTVVVRENSFTFYSNTPREPPVQLIRIIAPTAAAVLHSFDIQAAAVGVDIGGPPRVLATRQGALAAVHGLAVVDVGRCSKTFEQRLAKYASRGISFAFPQLAAPPRAGLTLGDKSFGEIGFRDCEGGGAEVFLSSHPAVEPDSDPYGSSKTLGNMAHMKCTILETLLHRDATLAREALPPVCPAEGLAPADAHAAACSRLSELDRLCEAKETPLYGEKRAKSLLFRRAEGVNVSHRPGVSAADWHGPAFNGWEEPFSGGFLAFAN